MLNLQESYNNVKNLCDDCRSPALNNAERQSVNESLQNIANALSEFLTLKAKSPLPEVKNNGEKEEEEPDVEAIE
jgi:hypothetical protein